MNVVRNDRFNSRGDSSFSRNGIISTQTAGFFPHFQSISKMVQNQSAQRKRVQSPCQTSSSSIQMTSSTSTSPAVLAVLNTIRNQAVNRSTKVQETPNAEASSSSLVPKTISSSDRSIRAGFKQIFKIPTPISKNKGPRTPFRTPLRTPNSTTSNTSEYESRCIVAISEGRGQARGEVGIAALDTRRPHLLLSQFSDSQMYNNTLIMVNVLNPVEILVPHTFCDGQQLSKLFVTVRDTFPSVTFTPLQRRHFSDARGLQQIQQLCAPEYSSVEILMKHKFYALASASALLKYSEHIQNMIFVPRSLKVEYRSSQNSTVIDVETAHRLELVRSLRGSGIHHSLLGILNHCSTGGGTRLLRSNILQPHYLLKTITARLDCVQEMVENTNLLHNLQNVLPKFSDVDRLLTLCMQIPQQDNLKAAETQLKYVLLLKTTLDTLPTFNAALEEVESEFLCSVREILEDARYKEILNCILEILNEDAHIGKGFSSAQVQCCFAVKSHLNGLLDVARKTYCEIVDDVLTMVKELEEEHSLPLKLNYSALRGFHIQLATGSRRSVKSSDLPSVFIQVQKCRNSFTFTTGRLIHADERCKDVLNEIQLLSNNVIFNLLGDIREHIGCLYKLCDIIFELDMLVSFARVSSIPDYVRPEFGDNLDVKNARHPMLDHINHTECVANDIFSSVDHNFHIITGPNMGGKSIYIRQVVLLQIMAQIGCYVPASSATFRLADHLFSRITFDDNIECNASTFVLEVKEVQYIMQTMTPHSIIIMDELGRGTSSEEGTAIAWALCDELLQSDSFLFLTTHFILLTKLEELYSNVRNHHFETVERMKEGKSYLQYTHRLLPGVSEMECYGLRLAQGLSMPDSIVGRAKELAQQIAAQKKPMLLTRGALKDCDFNLSVTSELLKLFEGGALSRETCIELRSRAVPPVPEGRFSIPETCEMEVDETSPLPSQIDATVGMNSTEITVRTILETVCENESFEK